MWIYRREVLGEAIDGLWDFIKRHAIWEIVLVLGVGATNYLVRDDEHGWDRAMDGLIPTAVVVGCVLLLVALWQLLDAPARLLQARDEAAVPEEGATLHMKGAHNARIQPGALSGFQKVEIEDCEDLELRGQSEGGESE